jgi:hypothetical protein
MVDDDLSIQGTPFHLIRLPSYDKALRQYRKLEPRLHDAVLEALVQDLEGGALDEVQGTGGWIKGRVASPSRAMGKRGGFRVIYLVFRIHRDLYLQTVYDHRHKPDLSSDEKEALRQIATILKNAYPKEG